MSDNQNNIQLPEHGKLTIPMTNDYLFRALLQQNNKVLTGLIASLLHLSPSEISSVEITNPIILGESINDKTFFLDIRVDLNQNTLINLEMQVINEHNWPERSLSFRVSLFKARTWEELHMLSQNNEYLKEASETVYHLTQEEKVRLQCQAREDYYRRMKGIQEKFEHYKAEKIQSDDEISELKQQIATLKKELEAKSRE